MRERGLGGLGVLSSAGVQNGGRTKKALEIAARYGMNGAHHKEWVIDQMVRALTGCPVEERVFEGGRTFEVQGESYEYYEWVRKVKDGEDGPDTYEWSDGIPP